MTELKADLSLAKLRIAGCEYIECIDSNFAVFHVNSPHSLTQAAGYLKYIFGLYRQSIYFRGQSKLYSTLSPSLVRGIKSQKAQSDRIRALRNACSDITTQNRIFDGVPFESREALLQHYGLKTSWIDLVDNVWISLWFACHTAQSAGSLGQYLHFERRDPFSDKNPFAYILLIAADMHIADPFVPGYFKGETTELVDLRVSAPSIFLRPHAQHGVLFRLKGDNIGRPTDYASQIKGVIRIDLRDALLWLGDGKLTGTHTLFPPAYYDRGYQLLLDSGFKGSPAVGSIHHIGT